MPARSVPSAPMSEIVTYEATGRVATITLNRPEARNAVNGDVATGMEAAIDRLEDDDDVWVGRPPRQHRGPGAAGVLRRRRPEGDQRRQRRPARHAAGRLRRLRLPRAPQAGHRRRRRPRHRRRVRDRARRRPRRRHHPLGVRARRSQAQPRRRRRRAVPPALGPSARPRRWRRSSPASRSRPSGPTRSGSSSRLVEPGEAEAEAAPPGRADHGVRAAGRVREPPGRAGRRLRGRRDAEAR